MTLAWSRHQYAELVRDQSVETWLGCHQRAFEYFNGVPARIIMDNPKCAITKACYYDLDIQRSYTDYAEGYGFIISPCSVADPQKKALTSYYLLFCGYSVECDGWINGFAASLTFAYVRAWLEEEQTLGVVRLANLVDIACTRPGVHGRVK